MYTPFTFEGRQIPAPDALGEALLDDGLRPFLVRAAVVEYVFADAVLAECIKLLNDPRPRARGAAIKTSRALLGRQLVEPVCSALANRVDEFVGIADPTHPGRTLAQSIMDYLMFAPTPGDRRARATLQWAMGIPELRVQAWQAVGGDDPEAVLPHLAALLISTPKLAESVATRFALVHTDYVIPACTALVGIPLETRKIFGQYLEKHLKRIFHVRRWAECRKILFGK